MVRLTNTYGVPAGSVLVGTDGSSWSQAALVVALDMAGSAGRPLTLIHVGDTDPSGQDVLTRARAEAARRAPELEIHAVLRAGDPREVLVASTEHAAVPVVGSRGRGPTRSLLLGSVSVAVTRRAHCPVVVVRPHHPGLVRQRVLVGADGSPESRPTLAFAFQQALSRRLPLTRPARCRGLARRPRGAPAAGRRGYGRTARELLGRGHAGRGDPRSRRGRPGRGVPPHEPAGAGFTPRWHHPTFRLGRGGRTGAVPGRRRSHGNPSGDQPRLTPSVMD